MPGLVLGRTLFFFYIIDTVDNNIARQYDLKRVYTMSSKIITRVVEQMEMLPASLRRQTLAYVEALRLLTLRGTPGKDLLEFSGSIPMDDLELMQQAINDGCEQVDLCEC
jgi:hypothetical protein